jgi:hypothetical protein
MNDDGVQRFSAWSLPMRFTTLFDAARGRATNLASLASRARALPVALIVAAGITGCATDSIVDPGGGGGGNDFVSGVVVQGTIKDPQGREIFGSTARVTAYVYNLGCSSEPAADPFEAMVNEAGTYVVTLTFDVREFQACLKIEAIPPEGSGFESATSYALDVDVNEPDDGIKAVVADFVLNQL